MGDFLPVLVTETSSGTFDLEWDVKLRDVARRYFELWPCDRAALIATYGSLELTLTSGVAPIATQAEILEMHAQVDADLLKRPPIAIFFPKQPGTQDVTDETLVERAQRLGRGAFIALVLDGKQLPISLEIIDAGKLPGSVEAVQRMRESYVALLDLMLDSIASTANIRRYPNEVRESYFAFTGAYLLWRESGSTPNERHTSAIPRGGDFLIPSATVFQATHRSVVSRADWNYDGTDYPRYDDSATALSFSIGGQSGDGSFDPKTEDGLAADLAALDPEWSIVYAAAMGAWTNAFHHNKLTSGSGVAIHVNDILELRGMKRHQSRDFKPEQKREIAITMKRLAKLRVRGKYTQPNGKERRITGALIEIVEDEVEDLFGFTPYGFVIRPGMAVQPLFEQSAPQFARFFTQLANLDTRQGVERIAYLIGLYLAFQWRIRQTHDTAQPFKMRTLLDGARVQVQANSKLYTRFRDQVEAALDRLQEDDVLSGWQYGSAEYEHLPARGWFRPWLECRVNITPPDLLAEDMELRVSSKRKALATKAAPKKPRRKQR